ncbi:MAG: ABC-F family ATP-binding cassette domain-containing protein [Flavobacteriales bacterium]|nr:ABC-F family ATP-binding cassette domain-containing protein [Flavobacteriales bacterium]
MNYLSVENLSKSYGIKELFQGISFGLNKGDKVGLIAKNGTGKSTLLRVLAGEEEPDSGSVIYRNDITIGFLSQNENFDESKTVEEVIYDGNNPVFRAIKSYNYCVENNIEGKQMEDAFEDMSNFNGWEVELSLDQILNELKVDLPKQKIGSLSGGQIKRLSLARVLAQNPDFMILDEPTNHLDLDMIEWLEKYLSKNASTVLMVTHDRYFLEVICNHMIELDQGNLYKYTGNYSYFLEKKAEREELEQTNITKAKNLMRTELEWMRRMPKARTTKSKSRQGAFYNLQDKATKRISKDELDLEVTMNRLGTKTVEFHKVSKSFGDVNVLDKFSYNFQRLEKLGIVGKNGTGKSSFLNMITSQLEPDSGKIATGETVTFGYFRQDGMKLKDDKRVIEIVKDIAEVIPVVGGRKVSASQFLERFLFPSHMHYQYVKTLSGGEKRRLYLLTVLVKNPNFLILDEPTNDLDIFTMNVLEEYLENFKGCLIVVTHDRYFMDKIVDHLFVFEGEGQIKDILGNYTIWREEQKFNLKKDNTVNTQIKLVAKSKPTKEKTKLSFKEKAELEKLEVDMPLLENKKTRLELELSTGELDTQEIMALSADLSELLVDLDTKTDRWLELSELS